MAGFPINWSVATTVTQIEGFTFASGCVGEAGRQSDRADIFFGIAGTN
jgi:hypothetical protein